ncbi:hypothetical protein, partial [Komagataeibacter melomenusus]|uniref:hypothetical protein n=1 Tax=Komagataeibacter melomenusus TaxID=2766578 RepID=UPI0019D68A3D
MQSTETTAFDSTITRSTFTISFHSFNIQKYLIHYVCTPNIRPMAAVTAIATMPQNMTRIAG